MNARLAGAAAALILAMPFLIGAGGGDDREDQIGQVAVAYARGFEALLRADPAEGERVGVTAEDLAHLRPTRSIPLYTVDASFRLPGDTRSIDKALVLSDLWWVVLSVESEPQVVVTVQWLAGADQPEAVGLNWVPALELSRSFERLGDPEARVVYLPEDAPVALGVAKDVTLAMPVANEFLAAGLELPDGPIPVAEYTVDLKVRLNRLTASSAVGKGDPGLGGGGAAPEVPAQPGSFPLAALLGPVAVVGFMLVLAQSTRSRPHRRSGPSA